MSLLKLNTVMTVINAGLAVYSHSKIKYAENEKEATLRKGCRNISLLGVGMGVAGMVIGALVNIDDTEIESE